MDVRPIPGLVSYHISEQGDVYRQCGDGSLKRLATVLNHKGYLELRTHDKNYRVHRLVALAFIGPCPDGLMCCHNDGNRTNNNYTNLRYDTSRGNALDRRKHGTQLQGVKVHNAKLSDEIVAWMRSAHAKGETVASLARTCRVSHPVAWRAIKGNNWAHVPA